MSNKKCPKCFGALAMKDNVNYCENCQTEYLDKYFDTEYIANNYQNIYKKYYKEYKPIDFSVKPSNYLEIYEQLKAKYLLVKKDSHFDYKNYLNQYGEQKIEVKEVYVDKFDDVSYESLSEYEKALVNKLREQINNNPEYVEGVFELFENEIKSNNNLSSNSLRGIMCSIMNQVPEELKPQYIGYYNGLISKIASYEAREAKAEIIQKRLDEAKMVLEAEYKSYDAKLYHAKHFKVIINSFAKAKDELDKADKYSISEDQIDRIVENFSNVAKGVKTKKEIKKIKRRRFTITSIVLLAIVSIILIGLIPKPTYYICQFRDLEDQIEQAEYQKYDYGYNKDFNKMSYYSYEDVAVFTGYKGLFWDACFSKKIMQIENNYEGVPVVAIGSYALSYDHTVEQIYLPETIMFINDGAFNYCINLQLVTTYDDTEKEISKLPNNIQYIGQESFYSTSIEEALLPTSLRVIYNRSFSENTVVQYPGDSSTFDACCVNGNFFPVFYDYISIYYYNTLDDHSYLDPNDYFYIQRVSKEDAGDAILTPTDVNRKGYKLLGYTWYNEDEVVTNSDFYYDGAALTETTYMFAKWEPIEYTITYNLYDGENNNRNVKTYTIEDSVDLYDPSKTGYTFEGWYKNSTFYTRVDEIDEGSTGDITLYAKFTPNTYELTYAKDYVTITFDYNYNSLAKKEKYNLSETIDYPEIPIRDGYQFTGWYTDQNCTNYYSFNNYKTVYEDMTLYAGWQSNAANSNSYPTYQIYNPEDYDYYNPYTINVNSSNSYVQLTLNDSNRHYIYFSQQNTGSYYPCYVTIYNLTRNTTILSNYSTSTYGSYSSCSFYGNPGDVIVIRVYSPYYSNKFNLYFDYFNEIQSNTKVTYDYIYETKVVTYDMNYNIPYRNIDGYEFMGYFTREDGSGQQVTNKTGYCLSKWNYTSDMTVYPYYQPIEYSITYEDNGGTTYDDRVENYTIESSTFDLPTLEKVGYTFDGWCTNSDLSDTPIKQIENGSFGDLTLYAKFTPKTFKISGPNITITYNYNYNGNSTQITYDSGEVIDYPTNPTRSGYQFRGWFTDTACTEFFDFTDTVTENITLYAGWQQLYNTSYSYSISEPSNYKSSSNYIYYEIYYNTMYIHFTVNKTGTYTFYYSQYYTGSNYKLNVYMYNMTTQTTVMSSRYTNTSGSYYSYTFTANAGDVIYISADDYYNSNYLLIYFSGFEPSTSSAKVEDEISVTYGQEYSLPIKTKSGYTFKGYFTGENGTGTQITDEYGQSLENWNRLEDLVVYPYFE